VAVLTATIEAIKNSQNFTWENVKATIRNLTPRQIVAYVFKGLLVLVGLFGLAYFRYTAGFDLATLIGPGSLAGSITAGITGVLAYIPQAFFTVFSIQKLIRLFSPSYAQQEEISSHSESQFSRVKSILYKIYTPIA